LPTQIRPHRLRTETVERNVFGDFATFAYPPRAVADALHRRAKVSDAPCLALLASSLFSQRNELPRFAQDRIRAEPNALAITDTGALQLDELDQFLSGLHYLVKQLRMSARSRLRTPVWSRHNYD
jgi:hypothetical protein